MPSFNAINYSLRPSKTIQRCLAFEGMRRLHPQMDWEQLLYVGMGSIWFADFLSAHKTLDIADMYSIEANEIGYRRAIFNKPFNTIKVLHGTSNDVLPKLYSEPDLMSRPWMIWLDYDGPLLEQSVDDVRSVVENAPPNSVFLVTFNARGRSYGQLPQRAERLKLLLGPVVPDDLGREDCTDERITSTLADLTGKYMVSVAAEASRPGGFLLAFRMVYFDTTSMVTVGGVLPSKGAVPAVRSTINAPTWPAVVADPITAPHLTLKEVAVLQGQLPCRTPLTRKLIQDLGFDLEEDQIKAFERYYRYYPSFAQIAS